MTITSGDKILLNNILVDFTNQLVFRNEKFEPIDAQGLKVLASLLAHYPETVTREQLLNDAWKGLVVSDNSLSQCITLLRKSLGDDPKSTTFIRTVPRKGYQLIAEISEPTQQARVPKTVRLAYQKKLTGLAFTVAFLVVGIWLWLFEQNHRATVNDTAEQVRPSGELYIPSRYLSSNPGVEAFLKFSPSGNRLAYSETSSEQGYNLVLFNFLSNNHQVLLNSVADEYIADWSPDERWLIYTQQTKDQCEMRIKFLGGNELKPNFVDDQSLMSCPRTDFPPSVSWSKNNELYLTREENGERSLIKLSLQFDSVTGRFTVTHEQVIADFHPDMIDLSADNQFLLMSEINHQEYRFTLSRLHLETGVVERIAERKNAFWGMSWYNTNNTLLHGGQLTQLDLSGAAAVLYHSPSYIVDLDYHPSGKLVVSEALPNFNLHRVSLNGVLSDEPNSTVIAPSTQVDYLPALTVNEDQLAFISSRNARGHLGLWFSELPNVYPVLLQSLPAGFLPISLQWAADAKSLLIVSNQRQIYRFSLLTREFTALGHPHDRAFYPHWLSDGQHIRYSRQQGEDWEWVTINIDTKGEQVVLAKKAVLYQLSDGRNIEFDRSRGALFMGKNNHSTEHLFDYRNPDELSFSEQGIYYFVDTVNTADIYFYEFESGRSRKITTTNASVDFAGTPRNIAFSKTSIIVARAGQHQADLVLLERKLIQ